MNAKAVVARTNQINGKKVDQIEISIADIWFRADIQSDRDIKLAKRLASAHGVEFYDYRSTTCK